MTLPLRNSTLPAKVVVYTALSSAIGLLGAAILLLIFSYSELHTIFVSASILILAVCIVAIWFLAEPAKSGISLLFLATYLSLFLIQAFFVPETSILSRGEKTLLERKQGRTAYPIIHPQNFLSGVSDFHLQLPELSGETYLPLSSLPRVRSVYCKEDGPWVTFLTDSLGFRNPVPAADPESRNPPLESRNLVVLGDSFVEGACVRNDQQLLAHLEEGAFSVVNLGRGGAGPITKYAILREYGDVYDPDVLMWVYFEGNDLMRRGPKRRSDLTVELQAAPLKKYLDDRTHTQRLPATMDRLVPVLKSHLDSVLKAESDPRKIRYEGSSIIEGADATLLLPLAEVSAGLLRGVIRGTSQRQFQPNQKKSTQLLTAFEKTIRAAAEQAKVLDAQMIFMILPDKLSCISSEPHPLHRSVLRSVQKIGLPVIDLWPVFREDCDAAWFSTVGSHLSPMGYERVGNYVNSRLASLRDDRW